MSSTQPPNGSPAATADASPNTGLDSSTDATIGRFRDAVQSLKEEWPSTEPPPDPTDQTAPLKSLVAEEFVLVDSHGERRATLSLDAAGGPALALSDANGRARATIRLGVDGAPSVVLYDTSGRRRLEVALKADGATGLGLYDETGEGRAELVVSGSGAPALSLFGPNGKRLVKLPAGRER
ncbi:MAG: hypothetical protein ACREPW_14220 [Candidatus Binataceae bacterium]